MRHSFVTKSASAIFVLALAAGGLGCAAPGDDSSPLEEQPIDGPRVRNAKQQVGLAQAGQVLSGIQGIWSLVGMIHQTVEFGRPIATGDIYRESLRLRADIASLSESVDSQFNEVLVATDAPSVRLLLSTIDDEWETLQTITPEGEASFFSDVRAQGVLTFASLNSLNATLMGDDGLGSGLIARVETSMHKKFPSGMPDDSRANLLGEIMLRMRLAQLKGFEVLSRAYASSGNYVGYVNIATKRAELIANLEAQGNKFFETMRTFHQWVGDAQVRYYAEVVPAAQAAQERAMAVESAYRRETVLQSWNTVPEGYGLDILPRLGIVSAEYGNVAITGSIAQMAMHQQSVNQQFSLSRIGAPSYMDMQRSLVIQYRCEGVPGTQTITIPNANGKMINLACSRSDRLVGNYLASPDLSSMVKVTKRDTDKLLWTKGKKTWVLAPTSDPSWYYASPCYADSTDPTGLTCYDWPDESKDGLMTINVVETPTRDANGITLVWDSQRVTKTTISAPVDG
jgi:hypothetical protein